MRQHISICSAVNLGLGIALAISLISYTGNVAFCVPPPPPITRGEVTAILLGDRVVACWEHRTIAIYDAQQGTITQMLVAKEGTTFGLVASAAVTGRILYFPLGGEFMGFVGPVSLRGMDIHSGHELFELALSEDASIDIPGFAPDGQSFYEINGDTGQLSLVDSKTGKLLESRSFGAAAATNAGGLYASIISRDGAHRVAYGPEAMVCFDRNGKEIWRVTSGNGQPIYQFPQQSRVSDVVAVHAATSNRLAILSVRDGSTVGEADNLDVSDIQCVSPDGSTAAVRTRNGTVLRSTRSGITDVALESAPTKFDCRFTEDGGQLTGMASLELVTKDPNDSPLVYERKSDLFYIYNAKSGRLVRKFDIKEPQ